MSNTQCYICGKYGHMSKQCWKNGGSGKAGSKGKSKDGKGKGKGQPKGGKGKDSDGKGKNNQGKNGGVKSLEESAEAAPEETAIQAIFGLEESDEPKREGGKTRGKKAAGKSGSGKRDWFHRVLYPLPSLKPQVCGDHADLQRPDRDQEWCIG